jgi:hypothetical protein
MTTRQFRIESDNAPRMIDITRIDSAGRVTVTRELDTGRATSQTTTHHERADAPPDRGPRAKLADELRELWRTGARDARVDAEQLLREASPDPRARLIAWSATAWRGRAR